MNLYSYETINHKFKIPINIFLTSINYSIPHWHTDYEVIIILKGELSVTISSKKNYFKEGDIVLINSKEIHEIESTDKENICLIVQLNESLFNETNKNLKYNFVLDTSNQIAKPKIDFNNFVNTIAKIGFIAITKDANNIETFYELKSLIYKFISDMFLYCTYTIRTNNTDIDYETKEQLFYEVINFLDMHYKDDDITENICKTFGIGEKTLYRLLKDFMNLTLKELILEYKINNSKLLLKNTNKSLDIIAYECGFSSLNTFFRQFKKHLSVTPNHYRQNNFSDLCSKNSRIQDYLEFDYGEGLSLLMNIINEKKE